MADQKYIPGEEVVFNGFAEGQEAPANAEYLAEGEVYVVVRAEEQEDEEGGSDWVYTLEVPNPDFDGKKKPSKKNVEVFEVEVFEDEVSRYEPEEEEEEEEEEAPPPKAKAKAKAKEKAKPKAKAKAPAKKAATKKGKTQKEAAAEKEAKDARAEHENDPDLKNLIILNDEEEDGEVLSLVAEAEDMVALTRELVEDNTNTEWRLGGVLYHLRVGKDWKNYDEGQFDRVGGWADFCDEVLGLDYRKAQYLVEIYTVFSRFGKGAEELANIGWSKAIQITKYMDEENADKLLDLAEEQSVRDLKESITESYKKQTSTKKVTKMVRFNFVLEESAASMTRELFELIKKQMGVEDDHQCFEQIVSEYAQEHLEVAEIKRAQRSAKSGGPKPKAKAKAKAKAEPKAKAKAKAQPKAKAKAPAKTKAAGKAATSKRKAS